MLYPLSYECLPVILLPGFPPGLFGPVGVARTTLHDLRRDAKSISHTGHNLGKSPPRRSCGRTLQGGMTGSARVGCRPEHAGAGRGGPGEPGAAGRTRAGPAPGSRARAGRTARRQALTRPEDTATRWHTRTGPRPDRRRPRTGRPEQWSTRRGAHADRRKTRTRRTPDGGVRQSGRTRTGTVGRARAPEGRPSGRRPAPYRPRAVPTTTRRAARTGGPAPGGAPQPAPRRRPSGGSRRKRLRESGPMAELPGQGAEAEGFEPSMDGKAQTALAVRRHRPD